MKKRETIRCFMACAAAVLLLAGCGGEQPAGEQAEAANPTLSAVSLSNSAGNPDTVPAEARGQTLRNDADDPEKAAEGADAGSRVFPAITLLGGETVESTVGLPYAEPGYTAVDASGADLTDRVTVTGEADRCRLGSYELTYTVKDDRGNTASAVRTVQVVPISRPEPAAPDGKVIYLTFDDGPGKYTMKLLDVLDKYNVKATFFVVNLNQKSVIEEEIKRGHSVGIHSATHVYKTIYASEEAYFEDLMKVSDFLYELSGQQPTLIRFPGGSSNTVSKFNPGIMTRLSGTLTDMGYQYFDWNVVSSDTKKISAGAVSRNIINGVKRRNSSVVLQHDTKKYSVDAVEKVITWGLANGYTFLPITDETPVVHHKLSN